MRGTHSKAKAVQSAQAIPRSMGRGALRQRQVVVSLRDQFHVKVKFSRERDGERYGVDVSHRVGSGSMKSHQRFSIVHAVSPTGQPIWTVPGVAIRVENPEQGWLAIANHLAATTLSPDTPPEDLFKVGDRVSCDINNRKEVGEIVDIFRETSMALVWVDKEFLHHNKDAGLREVSLSQLHNV